MNSNIRNELSDLARQYNRLDPEDGVGRMLVDDKAYDIMDRFQGKDKTELVKHYGREKLGKEEHLKGEYK